MNRQPLRRHVEAPPPGSAPWPTASPAAGASSSGCAGSKAASPSRPTAAPSALSRPAAPRLRAVPPLGAGGSHLPLPVRPCAAAPRPDRAGDSRPVPLRRVRTPDRYRQEIFGDAVEVLPPRAFPRPRPAAAGRHELPPRPHPGSAPRELPAPRPLPIGSRVQPTARPDPPHRAPAPGRTTSSPRRRSAAAAPSGGRSAITTSVPSPRLPASPTSSAMSI
jgi:hypothetical protein